MGPAGCRVLALGVLQVWWYSVAMVKGKMCTHDLASGRTHEVPAGTAGPIVLTIHLDGSNGIWMGHKGGATSLWSEDGPEPLCSPLRVDTADIVCVPRPVILKQGMMQGINSGPSCLHPISQASAACGGVIPT